MVEKTAPEGFVLNHDKSEVAFVYADQDTPVIEQEGTVGDDRQKVAIQVEKQDEENGATVAGAVFGIYNNLFLCRQRAKNNIKKQKNFNIRF